MDRHRHQPPRRRRGARSLGARSLGARSLGAAAVVAALALAGSLVALPAVAAPADGTPADGTGTTITTGDSPVASGDGWTVTAVAGGFVVTLTLDEPLPIRAAAPTLVVDGRDIGIASTSI
ncbi:hypothetical protein, partial [Curtobacterium sp. B8]|uniref:hypothetical protein n=1 Tax=Curtobacterium sp. B8 TaxID=95611 RepID=UPI0005B2CB91